MVLGWGVGEEARNGSCCRQVAEMVKGIYRMHLRPKSPTPWMLPRLKLTPLMLLLPPLPPCPPRPCPSTPPPLQREGGEGVLLCPTT